MAAQLEKTTYSKETLEILATAKENKNFLLSGGAGSGKTFSLVETITGLISQQPLAQIACITYTNAATQEIEHRANHENLSVSTIHDFLWSTIKHFQLELKETLITLINDDDQKYFKITAEDGTPEKIATLEHNVEYKDYLKLRKSIVSHDQIPILAHAMFSRHPKLCRIINDKYKFILVDEYQDTNPLVISILLEHLSSTQRRNTVGFFGDAMQSIYEDGVGDLTDFKGEGKNKVKEIKKEQNRRNPISVITLANKFRTDSLKQTPSEDASAPNMQDGLPIIGTAKFLYSGTKDISKARRYLDWSNSPQHTKELNLTHNLIAAKAGFPELMRIYDADKILEYAGRVKGYIKSDHPNYQPEEKTLKQVIDELSEGKPAGILKKILPTNGQQEYIDRHHEIYEFALKLPFANIASIYVDKDMLIDDQKADQSMLGGGGTTRDHLTNHLRRIQTLLKLYLEGDFNQFMRLTDFKVKSHSHKEKLENNIKSIFNSEESTIGDIIEIADDTGLIRVDDRLREFVATRGYIYNQVCRVSFKEFQALYNYTDGKTSFSTQHKTKGREFDNVLVVMDNGRWNNYNFEAFFTGQGKDTVINRTSKIVYVCCTRARRNLAFFYPEPSAAVLEKATDLFGIENVIDLDALA